MKKFLVIIAVSALLFTSCLMDHNEYHVSGTLCDSPENCMPVSDALLVFRSNYNLDHIVASTHTDTNGHFSISYAQSTPFSSYQQSKLSQGSQKITILYNDSVIFSKYDYECNWNPIDTLYINNPEE